MTEHRNDPPAEILDVGRRRRDERDSAARTLPPLRLGGPQPDAEATPSSWRRWTVLAAALAVGLVCGVLVANARHDAAETAAASQEARVIAGVPTVVVYEDDALSLVVPVYNAGPLPVDVLGARPEGWQTAAGERDEAATPVPPGTWSSVPALVEPDCGRDRVPNVVELLVRTDTTEQSVRTPLPPTGVLREARETACQQGSALAVLVQEVDVLRPGPDTLVMELAMRPPDPNLRFQLTAIEGSIAGFVTVDASELPVQFEPGGGSPRPVQLTWEVSSCELTESLGDVALEVRLTDEDGRTNVAQTSLPGEGVAALAIFGVTECGSGT